MTTEKQNNNEAETVTASENHRLTSELVKQANRACVWLQKYVDLECVTEGAREAFDISERLEGALVALERSEHGTIGALLWHLLADYRLDEPVAHDLWFSADVDQQAEQDSYDPLTESEKAEVLANMQRRKDANYGLNWDTLSCALDEIVPAKKREEEAYDAR